jgi:hypothetical protein
VPNARDYPVRILARELLSVRTGIRVRCTIGITFKGNGGHGDDRTSGKPLFQIIIFRITLSRVDIDPALPKK